MHELEIIETAMITALTPLIDQGVRVIDAYAGQFEDEAMFVQLRMPFILVGVYEIKSEQVNQIDRLAVEPRLWIGSRSVRGPGQATKGQPGELGVWDVLELSRGCLNGIKINSEWSLLSWSGDYAVIVGPRGSLTVYESHYKTRCGKRI